MKQAKWVYTICALILLLTHTGLSQDQLRGLLTSSLGDVAAIKLKAEAGDVESQIALAGILESKFRPAEALPWYRKAANQGNIEATYQVGRLLLFGATGIPNDQIVKPVPAEGIRWTYQAATNFHLHACRCMSTVYQNGLGVRPNLIEAYAWLHLFTDSNGGSMVGRTDLNALALKLDTSAIQQAQRLAAQFKAGNWQRPATLAIPEGPTSLKVTGIVGGKTPLAVINGKTLAEGESGTIPIRTGPVTVKCLKIDTDSVVIVIDGEDAPRVLRLK